MTASSTPARSLSSTRARGTLRLVSFRNSQVRAAAILRRESHGTCASSGCCFGACDRCLRRHAHSGEVGRVERVRHDLHRRLSGRWWLLLLDHLHACWWRAAVAGIRRGDERLLVRATGIRPAAHATGIVITGISCCIR